MTYKDELLKFKQAIVQKIPKGFRVEMEELSATLNWFRINNKLKAENKKLKRDIKYALSEINEILAELEKPPNHKDKVKQETSVFYRHVQIQNLNRIKNKLTNELPTRFY